MAAIIDADFRAVRVTDEFELVDSPHIAARLRGDLRDLPEARLILTPPTYYTLANGLADNCAINDALAAAAKARPGNCACGVVEPKYGDVAVAELERMASIGLAGVVWSARAQGFFANDHMLAELCRHAHGLGLVSLIHSAPYSVNEGLWRVWALAKMCPGVPLVVTGALESWENIMMAREARGGPEGVFYTLSMISESWDLDGMVASCGAEQLLFGSGGSDLFARTLGIVERSSVLAGAKDAILSGNAGGLFA
ncbi:MAG: amidohydrolase family protein [Novosphingobium sp.]